MRLLTGAWGRRERETSRKRKREKANKHAGEKK
jgi:hypothetical protein